MEKRTTYWWVRSPVTPETTPVWERLATAPPDAEKLFVGETMVENDQQRMRIFFADRAAQEHVTRAARDTASLVQEHMIPHKPAS